MRAGRHAQQHHQPSALYCIIPWQGDEASDRNGGCGDRETPAEDLVAEAAAARAAARAAVRQGAAARAKSGGGGS